MNVVITGTSRGIGLELARQALAKGHRVLAVARDPAAAKQLGSKIETLSLDLTKPEAADHIARAIQSWDCVDLLINNAGVMKSGTKTEDFLESFHVNTVVPFQTTMALLPSLKKSKQPKAFHVTSLMGSISDNAGGGSYAYRASKSALNMMNKSLSVDQPWLTTVVVHPGWVQTDMGGSRAPLKVEQSVTGIWSVIERTNKTDTGAFFDYRGERLPW